MSVAFAIAQAAIPIPERWKPTVAFLASCFLVAAIVGWIIAHSEKIQRFRHGPNGNKMLTIGIIAVIGAGVFVALYWFMGAPFDPAADKTKVADLKMTVISYRYNTETKELIANVQFVNNGPVRRIVMGAMFVYKLPTGKDLHYVVGSLEELRSDGDDQPPIYVEPGQPILATFKHKLFNEAALDTPGTIFGLEVKSLTVKGASNRTGVEVMEAVADFQGDPTKVLGFVTGRREDVSLDKMWGYNPMETQAQLRDKLLPKVTPIIAAKATPAPSAVNVSATPTETKEVVQPVPPQEPAPTVPKHAVEPQQLYDPNLLANTVPPTTPPFNGIEELFPKNTPTFPKEATKFLLSVMGAEPIELDIEQLKKRSSNVPPNPKTLVDLVIATIYINTDGILCIDATTIGKVRIRNNLFDVLPPDWDFNHDARAVELVNEQRIPVYQIELARPLSVRLGGAILANGGNMVVTLGEDGKKLNRPIEFLTPEFPSRPALKIGTKRIFKYPSGPHRGERETEVVKKSQPEQREWQPFSDQQITAWTAALEIYHISYVEVSWGQETEAQSFYRSFQKLGTKMGWKVSSATHRPSSDAIDIITSTDDPAGSALLKLFEKHHAATLLHDNAMQGRVRIVLPDPPPSR